VSDAEMSSFDTSDRVDAEDDSDDVDVDIDASRLDILLEPILRS
jgi:hypothetical protein